jgi:hypothetical protein
VATNTKYRVAPTYPVASCTSAHNAGDLVYEGGRYGVCVETNAASGPNTLITHGIVKLVVPSSLSAGQKIYSNAASHSAGATIQAVGTLSAGTTAAPDNHRSAAVTSTLTTTNTNVYIGTMMTASTTEGASVVADVELAANP